MKESLSPELLAALCHDLRGPLGALGTWVHVLNSGRADEETRARALGAMAEDVRAMGSLIEQLQMLATTLRASDTPNLTPIEVVSFLQSMAEAAGAGNGSDVRVNATEPSVHVLAEATRLRQAFWPFLSDKNAAAECTRELTLTRDEAMIQIAFETRDPQPITLALSRALVASQGGDSVETRGDGKTLLCFRFRLAP